MRIESDPLKVRCNFLSFHFLILIQIDEEVKRNIQGDGENAEYQDAEREKKHKKKDKKKHKKEKKSKKRSREQAGLDD